MRSQEKEEMQAETRRSPGSEIQKPSESTGGIKEDSKVTYSLPRV